MPNVLSPRDLVSRPDNMDETTHEPRSEKTLGVLGVYVQVRYKPGCRAIEDG